MFKNMKISIKRMVYISMFSVIMAICSWIMIPAVVPFTLQTFSIFCTLGILGGCDGTIAVIVYVLLGIVGLPVFSGFRGGIGILMGATGGYITGFIIAALLYWLITKIFGNKIVVMTVAMIAGLLACYLFGTVWYIVVYAKTTGAISILTALLWCVFPFIIPDIIKIALALFITKAVKYKLK